MKTNQDTHLHRDAQKVWTYVAWSRVLVVSGRGYKFTHHIFEHFDFVSTM